jgi:UPF0755 protein
LSRTFLTGVLVALLILGGGGLGGYRYLDSELHAARRTGQPAVEIKIPPGTSVSGVADLLAGRGVIGSPLVFELYVRTKGLSSRLEAGDYSFPGGLSEVQVIQVLEHSTEGPQVTLTIPEGLTLDQTAAVVEKTGLFPAAAYAQEAKGGTFTADFLAGRPPGSSLEGFLFPDTYFLDRKATSHDVIQRQLQQFGQKVTPDMRARAASHNLTFYQALVLASIVEREARFDEERAQIAGMYYNRLAKGMPLQSDPTLVYARGSTAGEVTDADKLIASPYNTYLHAGLPPGPICSPGLASIIAALSPAANDYLYLFSDHSGHAHFGRTLAEHQQNVARYGP